MKVKRACFTLLPWTECKKSLLPHNVLSSSCTRSTRSSVGGVGSRRSVIQNSGVRKRFLSSLSSSKGTTINGDSSRSINHESTSTKQMYNYLDRSNQYLTQIKTLTNNNNNQIHNHPPIIPASQKGLDPTMNRFHPPIVYHPNYSPPPSSWPENHTFPMSKFYHTAQILLQKQPHLPRPLVRSVHDFYKPLDIGDIPYIWISDHHQGLVKDDDNNNTNGKNENRNGSVAGPIEDEFLQSFLSSTLTKDQRRMIGFRDALLPSKYQQINPIIQRTLLEVSGTILTSHLAYFYGLSVNVAGGTHHATSSMGAGYTILNDLAIATNYLVEDELNGGLINDIRKVLVIDCDVHQGDGTASFNLFPNDDDKQLFTLSIHCQSNYPRYKANSTYDIGLPDHIRDEEYMDILMKSVNVALEETKPDFVFYDAGVDVYEHDTLGRLNISKEGIRKRDRWVMERCVMDDIPIAGVIGGGYDKDVVALGRRHAILHEEAAYVWRKYNLWKRFKTRL